MKEHGLLFIAAMARAAVAGIKTQTRRLPTASNSLVDGVGISAKRWTAMQFDWSRAVIDAGPSPAGNAGPYIKVPSGNGETWHRIYPRYQVGDRIWGRETWRIAGESPEDTLDMFDRDDVQYRADDDQSYIGTYRPSIHMPRWAARIVRDITAVRVEKLQSISEADALAEGIKKPVGSQFWCADQNGSILPGETPRGAYRNVWDSINGPGSWDANPPVIVIEFAGVQS